MFILTPPDSLICSSDLYVYLFINTTVMINLSLTEGLKIRYYKSSNFVLVFFLNHFGYSHFHIHFRIGLSTSVRKLTGIFIWIALNLQINLGRITILIMVANGI